MKKGLTEIVCVLDRSGSMSSIIDDAIGGFNTFLEAQQKCPGEAKMSIVFFDDQYDLVENGKDINNISPLNKDVYVPRGMTALLDAIGKTINNVGIRLALMSDEDKPEKVMMAILTDGDENASKEFSKENITEMIDHQKTKYSWDFVFLAANQDAIKTGGSLGISASSCMSFAATGKGVGDVYSALTSYTTSYRSSN